MKIYRIIGYGWYSSNYEPISEFYVEASTEKEASRKLDRHLDDYEETYHSGIDVVLIENPTKEMIKRRIK